MNTDNKNIEQKFKIQRQLGRRFALRGFFERADMRRFQICVNPYHLRFSAFSSLFKIQNFG